MRLAIVRWVIAVVFVMSVPVAVAADEDVDQLLPGLVATYRSHVDANAVLLRIDAKPALNWGRANPHPLLPPGPMEIQWDGVLLFKENGPTRFDAAVCGDVAMTLDGDTVLEGSGNRESSVIGPGKAFQRDPGVYHLRIRYRSRGDQPARLQIRWEGAEFAREPLPAWLLKHRPSDAPPDMENANRQEAGRTAAIKYGCARCHAGAFPGVPVPSPGPALADVRHRIRHDWMMKWLAEPSALKADARMPSLFSNDRIGFVERSIITECLLGPREGTPKPRPAPAAGDHRMGRRLFVSSGCATCHLLPDLNRAEQAHPDRHTFVGLSDRLPPADLASFLLNPHARYPDGRMPRLPLTPDVARDIAAYLLLWQPLTAEADKPPEAPRPEEISAVAKRLGTRGTEATAQALVREKRCAACHPGIGDGLPLDVPVAVTGVGRGCVSSKSLPRFSMPQAERLAIESYQPIARRELHPSPINERRRLVNRLGCLRCHQRDSDRPPLIEEIGATLGGAWLQNIPYQRTPRLSNPLQKYSQQHLTQAIREGVAPLRSSRYTYRMPAFGDVAESVIQAFAEADGELLAASEPQLPPSSDPTLATQAGPLLAGFQGYACISCHVWNEQALADPDPGAVGTDLTRVTGRIRRDWFDRFLENPARMHPGTPMPSVFPRGKPALLASVVDGDPARQREALWHYFALGKKAPSPKPSPPLVINAPARGEPPLAALIPIRLTNGRIIESLTLLFPSHDMAIIDAGTGSLVNILTSAQLLRSVQGRLRTYSAAGTMARENLENTVPICLVRNGVVQRPSATSWLGYDSLPDGVRIRRRLEFAAARVNVSETIRLRGRSLEHEIRVADVPKGWVGEYQGASRDPVVTLSVGDVLIGLVQYKLPPANPPQRAERPILFDPGSIEGSLERPGYRAMAYPRPRTPNGDDLMMPVAVAVHPVDGRIFVASMKQGEVFVVQDSAGDTKPARFVPYSRGLFQEAYSMLADRDGLYVLHRRNLSRLVETRGDGVADRIERVAHLPHGIADVYDYAYGLARDRNGAFVYSFAPYANTSMPGSGGALRLLAGKPPVEFGYGFRNPIGWCIGPDGEVFATDNQGEWVATNKLCHVADGRFQGFPNQAQRHHADKPRAKPAVWVPYGWAHSINGMAYDSTNGKFGPFPGQFFLAELMFGGAIIRADVEKVNGVYQGACFPFWGKGLLGPVSLAFHPAGDLIVGGITEPGWMAQPDRGALFRLSFTGQSPFEVRTIKALPRGFRCEFTAPIDPRTAAASACHVEHFRYEYTGAYGSPELDRTPVPVQEVIVSPDRRSVEIRLGVLVADRVYLIRAGGIRSSSGESLVHPVGAYTLNEIPRTK